jgi:hypothetical protein
MVLKEEGCAVPSNYGGRVPEKVDPLKTLLPHHVKDRVLGGFISRPRLFGVVEDKYSAFGE